MNGVKTVSILLILGLGACFWGCSSVKLKDGSFLAFFELSESPEMELDKNTPYWVQHIAMSVQNEEELVSYKNRLTAAGVDVVGPTDHKICKSIYFFDPSGHRMELTVDTMTPAIQERLDKLAHPLLEEWDRTKLAPDVDWMHDHTAN